jgi:hypothetical protein
MPSDRFVRWLLPSLLASSCVAPPVASGVAGALQQVGPTAQATRRGEHLLTLAGGPLTVPLVVPLWFDLHAGGDDEREKCSLAHEVSFFEVEDGDIYVAQHNPYCGGEACRVFDGRSRTFVAPEGGCIPGGGVHTRIEAWGRGVVVVRSDSEGVASAVVGTYARTAGFRALLAVDLGRTGTLAGTVTDAGIELRSPCPLLTSGCAADVDYSQLPLRTYLWREGRLTAR